MTGTGTKGGGEGRVTEPLRQEHRELFPHIEALADAGDAIGVAPMKEQRDKVNEAYLFLTEHLIPHAVAEDKVLYERVDDLIGRGGGVGATDTMRRDHVEVGRLTERLGEVGRRLGDGPMTAGEQAEIRRVLYGLHTLVGVHFAKEEEVYLPLLDRELPADEAEAMFEDMEQAAATQRAHEET